MATTLSSSSLSEKTTHALALGIPQILIVELAVEDSYGVSTADISSLLEGETVALIIAAGARVVKKFSHLPMIVLEVSDSASLREVLTTPGVVAVYEDVPLRRQLAQSLTLIGQPAVASAGYRGTGATIAILDTGVDYTRPAFGNCTSPGVPVGCKVVVSQDFAPPDGLLDDSDLHGTNVAAIAIGVAPEARLAALDVFSGESANISTVIAAINWCIANQATYRIVAMNLSLGEGQFSSPCQASAFFTPFRSARQAGILPVVAAGNDGSLSSISNPACVPGAISVGAVYDSNVGPTNWQTCSDTATSADRVACFSDASSSLTLLAPGALITAAGRTHGGTSQATPHVAGAVAVLRGAFPTESLPTTVSRLVATTTQVTDWRDGRVKPRLQLSNAVFGPFPACQSQSLAIPASFTASLFSTDCRSQSTDHLDLFYDDVYGFAGVAGQTVTVQMNSSSFNTFLGLTAPSSPTQYAVTNDSSDGSSRNSRISFTLTETGSWVLYATSSYGGETGYYGISVSTGSAPTTPTTCAPGQAALCLSTSRFRVQADWRVQSQNRAGSGTAVQLSSDTGYFWFFSNGNVELVVKVLDGRGLNGKFWVFYGALSDVEYTVTVTDTATGAVRTYTNPQGRLASVADTSAF